MLRILLAAVLTAVLAAPAGAYDYLYTDGTPGTPARGVLRIELAALHVTSDDTYSKDGTTVPSGADWTATWIPLSLTYGVTDRLGCGVIGRYGLLSLNDVPPVSDAGRRSEEVRDYEGAGFGDTWLWTKYAVRGEAPVLAVRGAVKLPTGTGPADRAHAVADTGFYLDDDERLALGDGQLDVDAALQLGVPTQTGALEVSMGYRYRMGQTVNKDGSSCDYELGNEFHFDLGYRYNLNDAMTLRLGLNGFHGSDDSVEGDCSQGHSQEELDELLKGTARSAVWINTSFAYVMKSGILLGFDVHHPLMGQNVPAEWGIAVRLGLTV